MEINQFHADLKQNVRISNLATFPKNCILVRTNSLHKVLNTPQIHLQIEKKKASEYHKSTSECMLQTILKFITEKEDNLGDWVTGTST